MGCLQPWQTVVLQYYAFHAFYCWLYVHFVCMRCLTISHEALFQHGLKQIKQPPIRNNYPGSARPEAGRIFWPKWKDILIQPMEDPTCRFIFGSLLGQRWLSPRQDPRPDPGPRIGWTGLADYQNGIKINGKAYKTCSFLHFRSKRCVFHSFSHDHFPARAKKVFHM